MYSVIPTSVVARTTLTAIAALVLLIAFATTERSDAGEIDILSYLIQVMACTPPALLILYLFFGLSGYWAPWRVLWRIAPILNESVFPDLNGLWVGEVLSNFPVKQRMAKGVWVDDNFDLKALGNTELLPVKVAMEIRASFFSVSLKAAVAGVKDGGSESIVVNVSRKPCFEMRYMYRQTTPEPAHTDESVHPGAAAVGIDYSKSEVSFSGHYWNLRVWRQGLNLAGRIAMKRTSPMHGNPRQLL